MTSLAPDAATISPAGIARYTLVRAAESTGRELRSGAQLAGIAAGLGLSPPTDVPLEQWAAIATEVVDAC